MPSSFLAKRTGAGLDLTTTSSLVKLVSTTCMLRVVLSRARGSIPYMGSHIPLNFYDLFTIAVVMPDELTSVAPWAGLAGLLLLAGHYYITVIALCM